MAPLSTLLVATLLSSVSANTVRWAIAKNAEVESQQLARRAQQMRRRGLALHARADTVTASLGNAVEAGLYYANVTVGTPGQDLQIQIDTGSSDVWVPSSTASVCSNEQEGGCSGGSCEWPRGRVRPHEPALTRSSHS